MPIQEQPAILQSIQNRSKASDEITRILNKETKANFGDRARSVSQNILATAQNAPEGVRGKVVNPTQYATERATAMAAPQYDIMKLADENIRAGGETTKAIMSTFESFADNPEDIAKLWAAAESDQEEITPQNAARFAARKAQELGLRSVKKMQAENQQMFGQAKLNSVNEKAGSNNGVSWMGGNPAPQEPVEGLPTNANLVQTTGQLLPPPVSGVQPDESMFRQPVASDVAPVKGVQVDLNLFPQGIDSARSYKNDTELRKDVINHNKQKDVVDSIYAPARAANGYIEKLNQAEKAIQRLEAKKLTTGQLQGRIGTLLNNPDIETLNNVESAVAMSARVPGTGAVSNFDAQQLLNQAPGANRGMEYNKLWIETRRSQLKNTKDFGDFYNWYVSAFGPTSASEANNVWETFRRDNPMVDVDTNGLPVRLPGYDADWRQYVGGKRTPENKQKMNISEMSDADLEAELKRLRGQ